MTPPLINVIFKQCPRCTITTEKSHGCNKIACPNCKTKWCFYCGLIYPNSKTKVKQKDMQNYCKSTGLHKHMKLEICVTSPGPTPGSSPVTSSSSSGTMGEKSDQEVSDKSKGKHNNLD